MRVKSQEWRSESWRRSASGLQCAMCSLQLYCPRPSTLSPPPARRGLSLTEVLIAMGILTLGLLGVAAIFPVGSYYMQRAEISERGAQIGRAAMNQLVTIGMLDPGRWMVMTPFPLSPTSDRWNTRFPSDGRYCPAAGNPPAATFVRPFAETLVQALSQSSLLAGDTTLIGKQFGNAFVIDPIGVSAMAMPNNSNANRNQIASPFPSSVFSLGSGSPFYSVWQSAGVGNTGQTWPIRRVTFQQPNGWQLSARMAAHHFRGRDDLAFDLPDRDDRPAEQNWDITTDVNGTPIPLARQWTGDYSWLATVVPSTSAARNAMATNPESYSYDVSVVVFYKRVMNPVLPASNIDSIAASAYERAVVARIISTGLTGGEVLLERIPVNQEVIDEDPFQQLKSGQWIMLCGPHPNSHVNTSTNLPTGEPRFVMKWYQVISIDNEGPEVSDPALQRLVTLRGPEWPWIPGGTYSNSLCAGIFRGAVAVHTKTLRLEGPRNFASGGTGGLWTPNAATVPPNYLR